MYYGSVSTIYYAESNFGLGTAPLFMNPPTETPRDTYFINGDPSKSQYTAYDSLSAGILYGLQPAFVTHYMGFDTNDDWVNPDTGRLDHKFNWVITMGGPAANKVVDYYEIVAEATPIYFYRNSPANLLEFLDRTKAVKASISTTADFNHEDYILIEQFSADSNNIMMIYAFNWCGTWAGGVWFKDYFWTHSNELVGFSYVILHWVDSNMDGNPQVNEISAYAAG